MKKIVFNKDFPNGKAVEMTEEEIQKLTYIPTEEEQILNLKQQLEATDYKIIKCNEYQMAGLPLPYDINELHKERQALRDKINQLEQEDANNV